MLPQAAPPGAADQTARVPIVAPPPPLHKRLAELVLDWRNLALAACVAITLGGSGDRWIHGLATRTELEAQAAACSKAHADTNVRVATLEAASVDEKKDRKLLFRAVNSLLKAHSVAFRLPGPDGEDGDTSHDR
jgi:hypothetical protein